MTAESDRLSRAVRLAARAEEAIGNAEKAARWLRKPNRALLGRRPLDMVESDADARLVEEVLVRIQHGLGA
jgi:putative toxin-antitoxin system antitoxin component (TIGR02293 family)